MFGAEPNAVPILELKAFHVHRVHFQGTDLLDILLGVLAEMEGSTLLRRSTGDQDKWLRHLCSLVPEIVNYTTIKCQPPKAEKGLKFL
jgi:hypothetical protein